MCSLDREAIVDAWSVVRTGNGFTPPYDDMNIMLPLDCFSKYGVTSLARRNDDFTFTSKTLSHASSLHSKTEPTVGFTAAFETNISILPKFFIAASNNCLRSSAFDTWHFTPITSK